MIKSEAEYLQKAMNAYTNSSCLTIEEFNRDIASPMYIKKAIRRYNIDGLNLRRIMNHLVIFYNCFGAFGTDMLLYKIDEPDVLEHLIPMIMVLGMTNHNVDQLCVTLNIVTIENLQKI